MRTLVYDVAADSGGAATVLQSFYEEFKKDTENEYIFVLSVYKLPETDNIKVLNFPEVKKSMLHRLYFDHFVAHKLEKKYKVDRVLSLQNIELPHTNVPQTRPPWFHGQMKHAWVQFLCYIPPLRRD